MLISSGLIRHSSHHPDFHGEPRSKYRRMGWQYDEYDESVASLNYNAEDEGPESIPSTPLDEREWDIRVRRQHSGDTSSRQTVNTIREWLNECSQRHVGCGKLKESYPPKRILRLSKTKVTLCEGIFKQIPYACLSHCWGETGPDWQEWENSYGTALRFKIARITLKLWRTQNLMLVLSITISSRSFMIQAISYYSYLTVHLGHINGACRPFRIMCNITTGVYIVGNLLNISSHH